MRRFLLCLIFLGGQMIATGVPPIKEAASPDKRFSVILDGDTGRLLIKDLKTSKEAGLIAEGDGISIYHVIVRWSPDGSKVAIEVEHNKWNGLFVFVRADDGFRRIEFAAPDALAMYAAHPPRNHPRDVHPYDNNDAVGKWLNNSEISMATSYWVREMDHPNDNLFTIEATYVLQITNGRAKVKDAKLKVTP